MRPLKLVSTRIGSYRVRLWIAASNPTSLVHLQSRHPNRHLAGEGHDYKSQLVSSSLTLLKT